MSGAFYAEMRHRLRADVSHLTKCVAQAADDLERMTVERDAALDAVRELTDQLAAGCPRCGHV
jgi:hypothetical protein